MRYTRPKKRRAHVAVSHKAIIRRCPPLSSTRPDTGDEAACFIVQPSGENSARRDKACTHTALAGNTTNHHHRRSPTRKTRLLTSSSSHQEKIMRDTSKHARTPHAQPRRITACANNDNADSTSQMSKSRRTHAGIARERDEPASSRKETNT